MEALKEMIGYPRYASYKESGVDWIGSIPSHWHQMPGFTVIKERSEKNLGMKEAQVLSLSYGRIIVKPQDKLHGLVPESYETYQLVYPGDIIIRPTDLQNDKTSLRTGQAFDKGIITSAYINVRPINDALARYVHYYLHALDISKVIYALGSGLRQNLDFGDFKRFPFLLPPLPEQTRIATFLDRKCGQIDQAIAQKERQIALLKERRQVLVQQAVTKGLDPKVKMKDSGVAWLGEIPAHWEVKSSKRLFGQRKERARKGDEQLTASQKHGVIPQKLFMELEGRRVTQVMLNADILKHVEKDDFVISMRSFQGGIEHSAYSGCISSAYIPLIPLRYVVTDYFRYLLKCPSYITALAGTSDLVRDGQAMRYENFCAIDLIIVPEEEQIQIASHLKAMDERTEKSLALQEAQITKLKEYRSILINAAVTGQIKVPEA